MTNNSTLTRTDHGTYIMDCETGRATVYVKFGSGDWRRIGTVTKVHISKPQYRGGHGHDVWQPVTITAEGTETTRFNQPTRKAAVALIIEAVARSRGL